MTPHHTAQPNLRIEVVHRVRALEELPHLQHDGSCDEPHEKGGDRRPKQSFFVAGQREEDAADSAACGETSEGEVTPSSRGRFGRLHCVETEGAERTAALNRIVEVIKALVADRVGFPAGESERKVVG